MFKRWLYGVSSILLVVGLMSGCQKSSDIDGLQLRPADENVETLTLFMPMDGKISDASIYKEVISDYNNRNSGLCLTVDGMSTADGFNEALQKRLESGNEGADIFVVNADSVKLFHTKGYFYDLSELPAYKLLNESAREQSTVEGTAYTIPLQMTAYGLYVNVGLLREYGLEPPQNLEEFLYSCKVLKEHGVTPLSLNRWYAMTCLTMARGLYPIYQSEDREAILSGLNDGSVKIGDYMVEGFRLFETLVREGYYGDNLTVEEVDSIKALTSDLEDFLSGKTAFAVYTSNQINSIVKEAPDMEFVQQGFPVLPDGTVCLPAILARMCVNARGAHVEEALKAVDYLTMTKAGEFVMEGTGVLSAMESSKEPSIDERIRPLYEDAISEGQVPIEDMSLNFNYWGTTRELCLKIIGGMSPEEAAEEYNRIQAEQNEKHASAKNAGEAQ